MKTIYKMSEVRPNGISNICFKDGTTKKQAERYFNDHCNLIAKYPGNFSLIESKDGKEKIILK